MKNTTIATRFEIKSAKSLVKVASGMKFKLVTISLPERSRRQRQVENSVNAVFDYAQTATYRSISIYPSERLACCQLPIDYI
jgi:hypothetical protein